MKAKDLLRNLHSMEIPSAQAAILLELAEGQEIAGDQLSDATNLSRRRTRNAAKILEGLQQIHASKLAYHDHSYKITAAGQREVVKMLSRREVAI